MFDSHCHLTDQAFTGEVTQVVARAHEAGVDGMVTIASDVADAAAALRLAIDHDLACTAGIHPHAAGSATSDSLERVRELASEPNVVALGETGLDYHYDNAPRDAQRRNFEAHLSLAADLGLPVVVHVRDADDDAAALIREAGSAVRGVLHCFAGGRALLESALEAGWYASFSGLITFRRYDGAALLRAVPEDRLLLETDSPYLAPVPKRGRRNEPSFLPFIRTEAARIREMDADVLGRITASNARTFYGLPT